ncbi:hypothetical protein CC79DRAFT_476303 [Sarocladium strictum]
MPPDAGCPSKGLWIDDRFEDHLTRSLHPRWLNQVKRRELAYRPPIYRSLIQYSRRLPDTTIPSVISLPCIFACTALHQDPGHSVLLSADRRLNLKESAREIVASVLWASPAGTCSSSCTASGHVHLLNCDPPTLWKAGSLLVRASCKVPIAPS